MSGKPITEFVGLRSKLYSFRTVEGEKKICKGIKKSVVKNKFSFEDFNNCLFDMRPVMRECNTLRSYQHEMYSVTTNKVALSAFDDKRYLVDHILTLLYGYRTNEMEIPEQLKHTSYKYPALAHSSKIDYKKTIEEVFTNLRIYVKPDARFDVKLQDIFKPFTKINTNSYSKLLKYVRSASSLLSQWEIQRNLAVWCATSGCGVAMSHILANIFESDPRFKTMSQELKERYENKLIYLMRL